MLDNKRRLLDPNKFSFIHRPTRSKLEVSEALYQNMTVKYDFGKATRDKPKYEDNESWYKPDYKDTFYDYELEGVTNRPTKTNVGYRKSREALELFFIPKKIRSRIIAVYFIMPKDWTDGELYYGNTKVADLSFK